MMTVEQAVGWIHAARETGRKSGLDNMRRLCALLGNPQNALHAIHVAGTNGKGSTCACIDAMLRAAGYRVGLYTSPYLQRYAERIRIGGVPIGEKGFLNAFAPVRAAVEALRVEGVQPTTFEIGTALAFMAFAQARVDVCVLEVGLGGRLDPTNVIEPMVCAITAIELDHQAILGETLEAIAGEKAGIIKPGVPVVTAPADPQVNAVFAQASADRGAPWFPMHGAEMTAQPIDASLALTAQCAAFDWQGWSLSEVILRLPGAHQLQNAAVALAVVALLNGMGLCVSDAAVLQGLAGVRWPARLEYIPGVPGVLLDGAHNAHGARALAAYVADLPQQWAELPRVLLCGVLQEKATKEMVDALADLAPMAVVTAPEERRALPAQTLAEALAARGVRVMVDTEPAEAWVRARQAAGPDGLVIIAGSLYLVGAVRALLCAEGDRHGI